jgi:hypothetical protein
MVMGVRSATTKLYISPSVAAAARHPTFLPLVTVLLLYSASYLTDIWQHDGFASPSSSVTRGKSIGGTQPSDHRKHGKWGGDIISLLNHMSSWQSSISRGRWRREAEERNRIT